MKRGKISTAHASNQKQRKRTNQKSNDTETWEQKNITKANKKQKKKKQKRGSKGNKKNSKRLGCVRFRNAKANASRCHHHPHYVVDDDGNLREQQKRRKTKKKGEAALAAEGENLHWPLRPRPQAASREPQACPRRLPQASPQAPRSPWQTTRAGAETDENALKIVENR